MSQAAAQEQGQPALRSFEDLTSKFGRDAAYTATPFLRPTRRGLMVTGVGLGAIGVIGLNDRWFKNSIRGDPDSFMHRSLHELEENNALESLGRSGGAMVFAGGFYLAGLHTGERERRVSFLIVETWALNTLTVSGLKYSVGRWRPSKTHESGEFNPFSKQDSFPSGHAASAFALGTTIALEYDDWRVDTLAYGTAGAVAWSRVQRNVHWLSDAVGGSLVGILMARTTRSLYFQDNRDWGILFDGQRVTATKKF